MESLRLGQSTSQYGWKPWEGLSLPSAPATHPACPRASRGLAKPSRTLAPVGKAHLRQRGC